MRTCLVVDDSPVIRKVGRHIIEKLDFEVEEASDGYEALEMCRSHMPDAVLLDWHMPVMDGIQFLHALRQERNGHYPKVLFCTTENSLDHILKALRSGANEYVIKPFDQGILQSKFREVGLI